MTDQSLPGQSLSGQTLSDPTSNESIVLPGSTIGMVGGGQLGRMFAMAAMRMGYHVVIFCGAADEPAAQVATRAVTGDLLDREKVAEFAGQCDVITLEFENIPAETIRWCSEFAPTYPSHHVLATAQDRLIEKRTLADAGLAVTPFSEVDSADSVSAFASQHGWPVIVKTSRSGYDGKGQHRVEDLEAAKTVPWESTEGWIAEKCIAFDREASVIVARSSGGEIRCFPPFENRHHNHILDVSLCPSSLNQRQCEAAIEIAKQAAESLSLVGLLCVELFVIENGDIMINEVAPRPHNSGHLTIEASHTSQFEQHVRAVCGLPLGSTDLRVGGAAMANLLGDLWGENGELPRWDLAVESGDVSLHLYGKADAKIGRKMGHATSTASDVNQAIKQVIASREKLVK